MTAMGNRPFRGERACPLTRDLVFLSIVMPAFKIKIPTAIFIPRKALAMTVISRKLSKNMEIAKITAKEGKTTPKVAARAPANPACCHPTKVAQLMAMGPGVDSAITVTFIISSWVIHFFRSTQMPSIMAIMA